MREKTEFNMISFTRRGFLLSRRVRDALLEVDEFSGRESVRLYTKKDSVAAEFSEAELVAEPLKDWCAKVFPRSAALIFVGAAGIAVRTIAPFLVSKATDPAVLVADEQGKYVISLLSGHLGGGNELAKCLAARIGAQPVITTASDVTGRLAVDVWAQKNNCVIANLPAAKCVAAELLEGKRIPVCMEAPIAGELPEEFVLQKERRYSEREFEKTPDPHETAENVSDRASITISIRQDSMRTREPANLHLIPRTVILGIGCRKGKSLAEIRNALTCVLEEQNVCMESIGAVASIDLKRDEPGLVALAQELNAPFLTFSAQALREIPGEYAPSAFVEKTTGVDNVCERAAVAALTPAEQQTAHFLCRKQAADGVTIALLLKTFLNKS